MLPMIKDTIVCSPYVRGPSPHYSNTKIYNKDKLETACNIMTSRVQERQQLKDQQSCISIFVAYLTILSST